MFSNRAASLPIQYYNRLPKDRVADLTFVLDPLIATAGTCSATVSMLKKWGTKRIVVIGVVGSTLVCVCACVCVCLCVDLFFFVGLVLCI